ncbi:hypothetical protein CALVIDRAFT_529140 [Calocera viscosa TUFC12733]|uniref:Uncharacterized protein n=1 Tax=Calocera viscosa (strain TUFC12733) TaxID=1330018 RepID=A0A167JS81_CALVF|nr:hypothetical protein CALVIDRAFT_529140 [Calocera viscosa TUFC12733]
MSSENKAARSHGGFTNRKTPKATPRRPVPGPDRRVVFKSVLHNPLQIPWPTIPPAIQSKVFAAACEALKELAPYYLDRRRGSGSKQKRRHKPAPKGKEHTGDSAMATGNKESKKRKREGEPETDYSASPTKKARTAESSAAEPPTADASASIPADEITQGPEPAAREPVPAPPLLDHLAIGINEVTRQLEQATIDLRARLFPAPSPAAEPHLPTEPQLPTSPQPDAPPRLILACRSDIPTPQLLAHLPPLVAAYNSLLPLSELEGAGVHLISLQRGAEHKLAECVGLRRVAVVGFDADAPGLSQLLETLAPVHLAPLTAAWLSPAQSVYIPTHVKQLRTTAPRDMGRAKRERVEGRKEAKLKREEKKATVKVKVHAKKGKAEEKGQGALPTQGR